MVEAQTSKLTMDNSSSDFIKQEHQEKSIIQNIEIKAEQLTDSKAIIQIGDLKKEETQQKAAHQPEVPKERVRKRWPEKAILKNQHEDEPAAVRIINITDTNVYTSKPKGSKPTRIPKRFKADNFDVQNVGRVIDGLEDKKRSVIGSYGCSEYIKAEKELIIEDVLPEMEICSTDAQNSVKRRKIRTKSPKQTAIDHSHRKSSQTDYRYQEQFLQEDQASTDQQDYHQKNQTEHVTCPTDFDHLDEYPSTSQAQDGQHQLAALKQEDELEDPEDTSDPTYRNPTKKSDDSDSDQSDTSNSNFKFKDGKFTCVHCNMCFKLLKNFERHECLICPHCKRVFTTRCALKRHVLHIHTATDEIFECKDCNKTFKAKKYLVSHIKSHEKIHECENCGMKYGNISRLNEHRIKHKNPEILICKLCNRKCSSRSSLKFHMRIHDVDRLKNLKCDKCSFTTDDNRTLVKHQKSHAKQEEKFKMSTEWLKCEKCPARLKNKQSLNNHMYYVHSEMSFQCNLCGIVVKTERNLKRHWKNIHEHENKS